MNILIGKMGRSVYFDFKSHTMGNGDEEAPILYCKLAKEYPEHNFYMIGKSDLSRYRKKTSNKGLTCFFDDDDESEDTVPSNIIDLFEDLSKGQCPVEFIEKKIRDLNIRFDAGIIFQGPSPNVGIPNKGIKTLKGDEDAKTLVMFSNYYGPIAAVLNETNTPYMLIHTDPRYIPLKQRDVLNDEKAILSQINKKMTGIKRIAGYGEMSKIEHMRYIDLNYVYSQVETIFLMNEKKVDFRNIEKNNLFTMAINSAGPQSDREKIIKEWILSSIDTHPVKIYGKWEESFVNQYPGVFEEKAIKDIEPIFWDTKYTFIPPFSYRLPNFVTQKFWKMIYYGIIPFFHPSYDTDKLFEVPEILRVKTSKQMWDRIDYLESNKQDYQKVLNHFYKMLSDDLFDGTRITNTINQNLENMIGRSL